VTNPPLHSHQVPQIVFEETVDLGVVTNGVASLVYSLYHECTTLIITTGNIQTAENCCGVLKYYSLAGITISSIISIIIIFIIIIIVGRLA